MAAPKSFLQQVWGILKMPPVYLFLISVIALSIGDVNSYGLAEDSNFFKSVWACAVTDHNIFCIIGLLATAALFCWTILAIGSAIKNYFDDKNDRNNQYRG